MPTTTNPAASALPALEEYQVSDLPRIGWLQITEMGDENMYFRTVDGKLGFVKLEG